MSGKLPAELNGRKSSFGFSPVHIDDLTKVVETAFSELGDARGKAYSVSGA